MPRRAIQNASVNSNVPFKPAYAFAGFTTSIIMDMASVNKFMQFGTPLILGLFNDVKPTPIIVASMRRRRMASL
jgi:hypothetical protein